MASATSATDHVTIRHWVEQRQGSPAAVRTTGGPESSGVLRIILPGYAGAVNPEHIPWHEWFSKYESNSPAAPLQEETGGGAPSRFINLVARTSG